MCPKVTKPPVNLIGTNRDKFSVTCVFPRGEEDNSSRQEMWYFWYDGFRQLSSRTTEIYGDELNGVYVRGGSIVPILQHEGALSLMQAFENPIELRIYLDSKFEAQGEIYLDDGESFDYRNACEKSLIRYEWSANTLKMSP